MSGALVLFLTPPAFAAAGQKRTCDYIKKPPLRVHVNLTIPDVTYDYTRTAAQMSSEHFETTVEWLQKNGIKSVGMAQHIGKFMSVRGLASGGYAYSMSYRMQAKNVDNYGVYYCPYLTEVNIDLFYGSKIFIAADIPKKSCEFNETMTHEWQHHTANLIAIKIYSKRLEEDLPKIAREIELRHGYVSADQIDLTFSEIKKSVEDMIGIYYDSIQQDSRNRNDKIDTPAEYKRVEDRIDACQKNLPNTR
ncbi:MAG: hypothetical protein H6863_01355 [Rhodospirillales bacterium]|nr:hypothetical protein [Rhodospirillales bacterium]